MPRIRTVKPDFWDDEAIGEISRDARLLFIGLITQADDDGRLKGSPKLVKGKLLPYDDVTIPEVSGWLTELADQGLIECYEVKGRPFISLPSWHKHQRISHKTDSALPSPSEADSTDTPENSGKAPERVYREVEGIGEGKEGIGEGGESAADAPDAPLSELLADLIAENDPDGKRPTVGKLWHEAERRLIELDKRKPNEAERLIRWTQANSFWRGKVLSMPKFRKQYGQLYLDAVAESQKANRAPRTRPAPVAAVDADAITQLVEQIPDIPKPDIEMHVYRLKQGGRPVTPESIRERHEATKKVAA